MSTPEYTYDQIAKMIDHSLLNPVLTTAELEAGCELAAQFNTASVCILPYYTAPATICWPEQLCIRARRLVFLTVVTARM